MTNVESIAVDVGICIDTPPGAILQGCYVYGQDTQISLHSKDRRACHMLERFMFALV